MRNPTYDFTLNDIGTDERKVTIEIEINKEKVQDQYDAAGMAMNHMEGLLSVWVQGNMIKGVYSEHSIIISKNWNSSKM